MESSYERCRENFSANCSRKKKKENVPSVFQQLLKKFLASGEVVLGFSVRLRTESRVKKVNRCSVKAKNAVQRALRKNAVGEFRSRILFPRFSKKRGELPSSSDFYSSRRISVTSQQWTRNSYSIVEPVTSRSQPELIKKKKKNSSSRARYRSLDFATEARGSRLYYAYVKNAFDSFSSVGRRKTSYLLQ